MLNIPIPGVKNLRIEHLILDLNGTIAQDGEILPGVADRIRELSDSVAVHLVTADTHGNVRAMLAELPVTIHVLAPGGQDRAKLDYVENLGPEGCVCVGNGRNDALMLARAELGVAVVQAEGAAKAALDAADVVCTDIENAMDLLLNPLRLAATLRN